MSFSSYDSVDYTYVINRALLRISEARANIDSSAKFNFEVTCSSYLRAVEALLIILLPKLRPNKSAEKIDDAKSKFYIGDYTECIQILDKIVEETLEKLNKNHLLLRGEEIRVTR